MHATLTNEEVKEVKKKKKKKKKIPLVKDMQAGGYLINLMK